MHMGHSRDGPGIERRAEDCPDKTPRPPGRQPSASERAVSYGIPITARGQVAGFHAAVLLGGSPPSKSVLWETGWEADGRFRARTQLIGAADGGLRLRWAEMVIFGLGSSNAEVPDDFSGPEDNLWDGCAGVREPSPRSDKPRGGAGSVALEAGELVLTQ